MFVGRPAPPADAPTGPVHEWKVQDVGVIVDECCQIADIDPCSELFIKHEVDGDVLQRLVEGPAEDLLRLVEGPSASCSAAKTIEKFGARSKLHSALRTRLLEANLPWTVEETALVGEHVALRVLSEASDRTEIAAEIAKVLKQQNIDGRSLGGMTADELARIAEEYEGDAAAGAAKLRESGVRVALAQELESFRKCHGHRPFRDVCQKVESLSELQHKITQSTEAAAKKTLVADQLKRLSGATAAFALLDESLRVVRKGSSDINESGAVALDRGDALDKSLFDAEQHGVVDVADLGGKTRQVIVPVHMTLMVKKLVQDRGADDEYSLVGTLIQRPLLYDLAKLQRSNGDEAAPYFNMRVNDGETFGDDCLMKRKVVPVTETMHGARWLQTSTTFGTNLPLKLYSVFSAHPFHIMAAEVMIELTSFAHRRATREDPHRTYELRPSLLCNVRDVRSLVSVRDYDKKGKIDEMKKWEILSTSPTVEYETDGDGKPGTKPFYTPKMRLTFYLYRDARQPLLETFMPIFFALFANILNTWKVTNFSNHLSNTIAIGLTLVFVIPHLSENEGFVDTFQVNWLYITLIFLALIVSALVPLAVKSQRYNVKVLATFVSVLSLVFPLMNLYIYQALKQKLKKSPHVTVANPCTFNGREEDINEGKFGEGKGRGHLTTDKTTNPKGSKTAFNNLCQFFDTPKEPGQLRKAEGLIDSEIEKFLDVYEPSENAPWQMKGKCFFCGYTRKAIGEETETYTHWLGDVSSK